MSGVRRAWVAVAVASAVIGGSACGGGDGGPDVERAAYIDRADDVCAELRAEVNALPFSSPDTDVVAGAFREGARLGEEQVRELRAIPIPEGDEERIGTILELAEELNRVGRAAADAKAEDDDVRFRELIARSRALQRRQRELALAYGFRDCAGRP